MHKHFQKHEAHPLLAPEVELEKGKDSPPPLYADPRLQEAIKKYQGMSIILSDIRSKWLLQIHLEF